MLVKEVSWEENHILDKTKEPCQSGRMYLFAKEAGA